MLYPVRVSRPKMPELARVITPTGIGAAVHSRIADCRRKFSMTIEQRGQKDPATGLMMSWYRFSPN